MARNNYTQGRTHRGLFGRKKATTTTTTTTNPITRTRKTKTTTTGDHHPKHHHAGNTTTGTAPAHHHRRKPSLGDKISGAMLKLKGKVTGKPGVQGAGTRRMHGTDGRGSHRY